MIVVEWYRENSRFIKIELYIRDCVVEDIVFSGDFFEEPEGLIESIEENIRGLQLSDAIKVLESLDVYGRIIGVDWRDVYEKLCSRLREVYGECIKE